MLGDGVFTNVMAIGIPAALGALVMGVSQIVVTPKSSNTVTWHLRASA